MKTPPSARPSMRGALCGSRTRSMLDSLEPRLLLSATLTADAGPDLSADEGAAVIVEGSFVDTGSGGGTGSFDLLALTNDGVNDSKVKIDGDRVIWDNGGSLLYFDGTTDVGGNPNILNISAAVGATSTNITGLDLDGDRIVFTATGSGGGVFVYNITAGTSQNLASGNTQPQDINIEGDLVVWERDNGAFQTVLFYDLANPTFPNFVATPNTVPGTLGDMVDPVLENGVVYWVAAGTGGFTDVFAKDMTSGIVYNVSNTPTQDDQNIAADNGIVAWNTVTVGGTFADVYVFDGRGYDGSGTAPLAVQLDATGLVDILPAVSGTNVVWESTGGGERDIYTYNVDLGGTPTALTSTVGVDEGFAQISGDNVIWTIVSGGPAEIVHYDLSTGTTTVVGADAVTNAPAVISGSNVAYLDTTGAGGTTEVVFAQGGAAPPTYTFTWDFGDGTVITNASLTESHTYLDDGVYTATLTVESSTGDIGTDTATITVNNVAPTLAGVSLDTTSVDEGGGVTLTGSFTDAGVLDTHTVVVTWGDGSTSNAVVDQLSGTFQASHTYLDDQPSGTASDLAAISITLSDDDGGDDTASESVTVNNLAPVVTSVTGPTQAVRGQTLNYSGSFTDAGTLDTHTQTWTVTDGSNNVVATGTGSSFTYTPSTVGSFTVTYTVTDDDTGADDGSVALSTSLFLVTADPVNPSQTAVLVGGSAGSDTITISGGSAGLTVRIGNTSQSGISADRVIVYAGDGNDQITVNSSAGTITTELFGGAGNDLIIGGRGSDTIVGGAGVDLITGGGGRDLLIGGEDSDLLIGNQDDDILIAGDYTGQDDLASLRAVMANWLSSSSYASRVASLSSLLNTSTVSDDGNLDLLLGLQGQDYFLFNDSQDLTDRRGNELFTDTEIDFLANEA